MPVLHLIVASDKQEALVSYRNWCYQKKVFLPFRDVFVSENDALFYKIAMPAPLTAGDVVKDIYDGSPTSFGLYEDEDGTAFVHYENNMLSEFDKKKHTYANNFRAAELKGHRVHSVFVSAESLSSDFETLLACDDITIMGTEEELCRLMGCVDGLDVNMVKARASAYQGGYVTGNMTEVYLYKGVKEELDPMAFKMPQGLCESRIDLDNPMLQGFLDVVNTHISRVIKGP